MSHFVVRAHAAPTEPDRFLAQIGDGAHVEYLAQIIINTLFVSKGHRDDVTLTLVMENSRDFSRAVTLSGSSLGNLGGLTEASLLAFLADCLAEAAGLGKGASVVTSSGIDVRAISFEHRVKELLTDTPGVYLLDRKGSDIRDTPLPQGSVFLLTDHIPMPRKLQKSLVRQGATPISLGPVMLHASQCVVVVQNEMDRQ